MVLVWIFGTFLTGILLVVIAIFSYGSMLTNASTPWFLIPPIGDTLLWLFFRIGTQLRKKYPLYAIKKSQEGAALKAMELSKSSPGSGGVCFVGSSTFTYWRCIAHDFAELNLPIINAGFGGSCTYDLLTFADVLCAKYQPRVVVYFCGTNNIAQGMEPSTVLDGFVQFLDELHKLLPRVHVIFLGITTTPFFRRCNINDCLSKARIANDMIAAYCHATQNVSFVHTESSTCDFVRNSKYFLGDLHHLNDEGHTLLAQRVLLPAIKEALGMEGGG